MRCTEANPRQAGHSCRCRLTCGNTLSLALRRSRFCGYRGGSNLTTVNSSVSMFGQWDAVFWAEFVAMNMNWDFVGSFVAAFLQRGIGTGRGGTVDA